MENSTTTWTRNLKYIKKVYIYYWRFRESQSIEAEYIWQDYFNCRHDNGPEYDQLDSFWNGLWAEISRIICEENTMVVMKMTNRNQSCGFSCNFLTYKELKILDDSVQHALNVFVLALNIFIYNFPLFKRTLLWIAIRVDARRSMHIGT